MSVPSAADEARTLRIEFRRFMWNSRHYSPLARKIVRAAIHRLKELRP